MVEEDHIKVAEHTSEDSSEFDELKELAARTGLVNKKQS